MISPVIGTFEEEDEALELATLLTWLLPLVLLLATLADVTLFWAYMRFGHPWRIALDCQVKDLKSVSI
jgi:hypothetical protein